MLSTPSLGITVLLARSVAGGPFADFQLPLSGSHAERTVTPEFVVMTFNSLSRDHLSSLKPGIQRGAATFNSLSRDHIYAWFVGLVMLILAFQLPLSGSRASARSASSAIWPSAFNSLSRDHTFHLENNEMTSERSFNSLSRDHVGCKTYKYLCSQIYLSTPSLGITVT